MNGKIVKWIGRFGTVTGRMVLNIFGFSRHTYHVHISEFILLIVAIILEISSSLNLCGVKTICAGQCLLFAKLFERARILQGSNIAWCYLPLFCHFVAGSSSVFLFRFIRGERNRSRDNCIKVLRLVAFSTCLVFLAAVVISSGFHTFCDSFVINSCSDSHFKEMDWRNFTPNYSDCGNAYVLLQAAEVYAWRAVALMCVLCVTHAIRLSSGLQTSSTS